MQNKEIAVSTFQRHRVPNPAWPRSIAVKHLELSLSMTRGGFEKYSAITHSSCRAVVLEEDEIH